MSDAKSQIPGDPWPSLRQPLHAWYRSHHRALPWRTEPSLYRTVVSEFMCQQTQIETVLPYFARWMRQFPDFAALAEASEEAVLTAWSGLGYYARARNLHRLAQSLAPLAEPPRTPEAWQRLPGIGPYTAAAICSIAFDHPCAVVDGNVIRVLARVGGIETHFTSAQAAVSAIRPLADGFLEPAAPGLHNQAVMELGAMVCLKHRPACLLCPLRPGCRAQAGGLAEELPRIQRRATERVTIDRLWIVREGRILLQRQGAMDRRLARLVELPRWPDAIRREEATLLGTRTRGISHQRIEERIHQPREAACAAWIEALVGREDHFFHPLGQLDEIPLSGPHRKWIRELGAG